MTVARVRFVNLPNFITPRNTACFAVTLARFVFKQHVTIARFGRRLNLSVILFRVFAMAPLDRHWSSPSSSQDAQVASPADEEFEYQVVMDMLGNLPAEDFGPASSPLDALGLTSMIPLAAVDEWPVTDETPVLELHDDESPGPVLEFHPWVPLNLRADPIQRRAWLHLFLLPSCQSDTDDFARVLRAPLRNIAADTSTVAYVRGRGSGHLECRAGVSGVASPQLPGGVASLDGASQLVEAPVPLMIVVQSRDAVDMDGFHTAVRRTVDLLGAVGAGLAGHARWDIHNGRQFRFGEWSTGALEHCPA